MKATLLRANGTQVEIEVNTQTEAFQIVCDFKWDMVNSGPYAFNIFAEDKIILVKATGKSCDQQINAKATEICLKYNIVGLERFILGDAIVFNEPDYHILPYE